MPVFSRRWKASAFISLLICLLPPHPVLADVIFNETQALDFGEWAILGNHGVYTIMLQANGSYSSSPNAIMINPPHVGIYKVTGLDPNVVINSAVVTMVQPLQMGGSEDFIMDNFDVVVPNADSAGETTITLGARVKTTGSGTPYNDGMYSGQIDIDLNL